MNLHELFAIRETISTAVEGVIETATGIPAYSAQDSSTKPDSGPLVDVDYDPGESMGHKFIHEDVAYDDAWRGTLTIKIRTVRGDSGQTTAHRTARAKIIAALQPGRGLFTTTNLPYHQLTDCRLQNTPFTIDSDNDFDVSDLVFSTVAHIRSSAWAEVD